MRPTSGRLAVLTAWTSGFRPVDVNEIRQARRWDQPTTLKLSHPDGRRLTLTLTHGNGWQVGRLRSATGDGDGWATDELTTDTYTGLRRMLLANEPDRDSPYCGGQPIRQARALTGRERDILGRIIHDIIRAVQKEHSLDLLRQVIHLDGNDGAVLQELEAVLDARDD